MSGMPQSAKDPMRTTNRPLTIHEAPFERSEISMFGERASVDRTGLRPGRRAARIIGAGVRPGNPEMPAKTAEMRLVSAGRVCYEPAPQPDCERLHDRRWQPYPPADCRQLEDERPPRRRCCPGGRTRAPSAPQREQRAA